MMDSKMFFTIPSEEEFDSTDVAVAILHERVTFFPVGSTAWFMKRNAPTYATVLRHELAVKNNSVTVSTVLSYPGNDSPEYICRSADALKYKLFIGLCD